jgi:RNA polymerase sigma factor (sigma-70 family)
MDATIHGTTASTEIDRLVERSYEDERPGLERYVRSLVRDTDEAADVCQEAFVRLLVAGRAGQLPDAPGAWVRRVAHNLVVSNARRRQTRDRTVERLRQEELAASTEESIVNRERDRDLAVALAATGDDDRKVMLLAAQGYRASEIGARIGRTELATRTLLCRARGRLRAQMLAAEPA